MRKTHKKVLSIITVLSILGGFVSPLLTGPSAVYAADVSSYIDLGQDTGGDGVVPSTITSAPAVDNSGTATDFYISFTPSTGSEYAVDDTITVNIPGSFTAVDNCTVDVTDADDDGTPDGAMVLSTDGSGGYTATYTFTAATTNLTGGDGVEVCFNATPSTTRGNYSVYITDGTDTSSALVYVSDGTYYDNDVLVTAQVPTNLALRVMDPTSEVVTDSCDLGVLNPTAVNSCSYRVAAGTNHASGLYVEVVADSTLDNATDDIDDVSDTSIDAGTEEHGFQVTAAGFDTSGTFAGQAFAVPQTETEILSTATTVDDAVTGNWSTVEHSASVSTITPAGAYDQLVTYRAFANS